MPVQTQFGIHIVRLEKRDSGRLPPVESVDEQIREQLAELARGFSLLHQASVRSSDHHELATV